jgi:8-oxo-dGTP pyrophosphatase MutT (NUDIX family)
VSATRGTSLSAILASAGTPLGRWRGVLATEGEWTGDDRFIEPGAMEWDTEIPAGVPLRWAEKDTGGHQGAEAVGWIDHVERQGADIIGEGPYFDQGFGDYLERAGKVGVSVDMDDEVYTVEIPAEALGEENPVPGQSYPVLGEKKRFSSARLRGATGVQIPAFVTGYVELATEEAMVASALTAAHWIPPHAPAGSPAGGKFISPDGKPGRVRDENKKKRKPKVEKPKLTKEQREVRLVKAILAALNDVLNQLSGPQEKALIENIKANAKAFIEGQANAPHHGGGGNKGKKGPSKPSTKKTAVGTKTGPSKSGGGTPNTLPAGAAGIIKGVEMLLVAHSNEMKPETRQKLKSAVNRLNILTTSHTASVGVTASADPTPYDSEDGITHAGILLTAEDTGRWLMLQRALTEGDKNGGLWEFPGGGIDDNENPFEGATREFGEEVGVPIPDSARLLGRVDSGIYRLHVLSTPSESDVAIDDNVVHNPDYKDGDLTEAVAWWDPEHVQSGADHIRSEVVKTDWDAVEAVIHGDSVAASVFTRDRTRGPGDGPDGLQGRLLPTGAKGPPKGRKRSSRGPGRPRQKGKILNDISTWRKHAHDRLRSAIKHSEGGERKTYEAALKALNDEDNARAHRLAGSYQLDLGPIPTKKGPAKSRVASIGPFSDEFAEMFDVSRMPPKLILYWTKGEGAAKIRWGVPGDFDRCVRELDDYTGKLYAKGTCANLHKIALGVWPGQEAAAESEEFAMDATGTPVGAEVTEDQSDDFLKALDNLDQISALLDSPDIKNSLSYDKLSGLLDEAKTLFEEYVEYTEDPTDPTEVPSEAEPTGVPQMNGAGEEFADISQETRDKAAKAGEAMPDGSYPIRNCADLGNAVQAIGRAKDPEATKTFIKKRAGELNCPNFTLPDGWAASVDDTSAVVASGDAVAAPVDSSGDLTDADKKFLEAQNVSHQAAIDDIQKTLDAGNLSPAAVDVANNLIDEIKSAMDEVSAVLGTQPQPEIVPNANDALTASAAPVAPPDEWFQPFDLGGPTPITITADGRVYGHLTTWNSCHRGEQFQSKGMCVKPPSDPEAPFFQMGQVLTASGALLDVGTLTVGGGHADVRKGLIAALEHYDDVSTGGAVVKVAEDEHGIALFGSVVSDATPEQVAALRRAPLSGDWRKERGRWRLVAAHAVNTPGYPIPRSEYGLVASGGTDEDVCLLITGRPCRDDEPTFEVPDALKSLAASVMYEDQPKIVAPYVAEFEALRAEMASTFTNDLREAFTNLDKEEV